MIPKDTYRDEILYKGVLIHPQPLPNPYQFAKGLQEEQKLSYLPIKSCKISYEKLLADKDLIPVERGYLLNQDKPMIKDCFQFFSNRKPLLRNCKQIFMNFIGAYRAGEFNLYSNKPVEELLDKMLDSPLMKELVTKIEKEGLFNENDNNLLCLFLNKLIENVPKHIK